MLIDYLTTLSGVKQTVEQALAGPCTVTVQNIADGLMLAQFTKYLRQLPIEPDIQLNLLASELAVTEVV